LSDLTQLKYLFFFTRVKNLGNVRIKNIVCKFVDAEEAYNASKSQYLKIEGISKVIADEIILSRDHIFDFEKEFDRIIESAERKNVKITTIFDKDYPENLKRIFDAPVILYYKGNLNSKDKYSVSIVGTRRPTGYGRMVTERFSKELSQKGIPVISGLASGIDSMAHKTSLTNNNLTYAVLGCGADIVYPPENRKLYEEISEKGAVISEFGIGEQPDRVNFPRRNRVISGISLGTIVIESGIKGGALLTAELALDQNKEVFAVPGYINSPASAGTNFLIKNGHAKLVTSSDDVINELEHKLKPVLNKEESAKKEKQVNHLSNVEKKIFESIEYEPLNIDVLNERTGLTISDCLVNLLSLEFKGLIRQLPGKNFVRV
jgi:DNA processing protein